MYVCVCLPPCGKLWGSFVTAVGWVGVDGEAPETVGGELWTAELASAGGT